MIYQEKKYRVDSFTKVENILHTAGAKKLKVTTSKHYYARQNGNDVVKLVSYKDKSEVHILEESQGRFILKENIPVENIDTGLQWLKDKGYQMVDLVGMVYTDYAYKDGIVGLYVINNFLYSVILDFPEQQSQEIEKELGLTSTKVISVPYNKYLQQIDQLHSMKLGE